MKLRLWEEGRRTQEYDFDKNVVRIGRDPRCDVVFDSLAYPKVSGLHAQLDSNGKQVQLSPLSKSNLTLLNNEPVVKSVILKVGDRIQLGFTGPTIEIVSLVNAIASRPDNSQRPAIKPPTNDEEPAATLMSGKASDYFINSTLHEFPINQGGIIGRDAKHATYLLDHPQVSRVHARITLSQNSVTLTDLGSANGTFCNGKLIVGSVVLKTGDAIDIGPFGLTFDGTSLKGRSRSGNVRLSATCVGYTVPGGGSRGSIALLNDVDLVVNPGEFLCIIGPSGSGKSTLLNLLSGRRTPSSGAVGINNRDLHDNFSALKQDIAVVPQASVLHEMLSVEQSFRYTSQLRLPRDLRSQEVDARVNSVLGTVGLEHRREVRISQLSGGQLRRAGLGGELLSDPSLLFLDEVTSGLDEHSDGEMMRLFRSLADQGKTLVCITHNLAHVEESCHLVAVLTVGGRLAFLGSPSEALAYFKVGKLADIYIELQKQAPELWAEVFQSSKYYTKYITGRQVTPLKRQEVSLPATSSTRRRVSALRQFSVVLRRTLSVWRGDWAAAGALFGQALLVAVLLCLVFGKFEDATDVNPIERISKIRNLLFLVIVSCFWLGCNNSVKELVRERQIYRRERDFNLIPEAYLIAKLVFMCTVSIVQSLQLAMITLSYCGASENISGILGIVATLSLAGATLGLAISAVAKNEEMAVALVPIVIIPQIVLAGVVTRLPEFAEWLACLAISTYWGQHGVNACLVEADQFVQDYQPAYESTVYVIGLHALVFLAIAWVGVRRK